MLKHTTKNLNKVLFELERFYFETNNTSNPSYTLERWSNYTDIINQMVVSKKTNYLFELYYRVTAGENINSVLMELIHRDNELFILLYSFNHMLKEYRDFDSVKIFF